MINASRGRSIAVGGAFLVGGILLVVVALGWSDIVQWYRLRPLVGQWHLRHYRARGLRPTDEEIARSPFWAIGDEVTISSSGRLSLRGMDVGVTVSASEDKLRTVASTPEGVVETEYQFRVEKGELVLDAEFYRARYAQGFRRAGAKKAELEFVPDQILERR
ncbi:MAG: hypothetical protein AAF517_10620 [Planctomycetota bacterium]